MRKEALLVFASVLLVSLAIPGISAEILIGQPDTLYNWGDDFNVTITLGPDITTKDFASVNLICEDSGEDDFDREAFIAGLLAERAEAVEEVDIESNETNEDSNETVEEEESNEEEDNVDENGETIYEDEIEEEDNVDESNETVEEEVVEEAVAESVFGEVEIYKSPQNILEGEHKDLVIETTLDKFFIGSLKGECYIRASYGLDEVDGPRFAITKNIDADMIVDGFAFGPGEGFEVSGNAYKSNGKAVDGFIEATLIGLNLTTSGIVEDGFFNFTYNIPYNAAPGDYDILAVVYERDDVGDRVNEGNAFGAIRVNQVTRDIGIAVESQSVDPETDMVYTVLLYDQAGSEIDSDVEIFIYDPEGNVFTEGLAKAGEANRLYVEYNALPGYWKIDAKYGDLETSRAVFVEALERVDFELTNETLVVTNTGNVPYTKPLEVQIGEDTKIQEIDLAVGEGITYTLSAPDGDYGVSVTDGVLAADLGTTFLTGKAISIREGKRAAISPVFIWIIVILVLLAIIVYFVRRFIKKRKGPSEPKTIGEPMVAKGAAAGSEDIKSGRKEESTVVVLNLKNLKDLGGTKGIGSPVESINRSLMLAKKSGAKIYVDGNYRVAIFSPMLTKAAENNVRAIKVARDVENILKEHNEKYATKIDFGIGVNSGDMIVESREGKFRFTSTGNTIGVAKRISGSSKGEILMSEGIHRKAIGKIKSTKIPTANYWRVRDIVDREKHKNFISKFKKSAEKTKAKKK